MKKLVAGAGVNDADYQIHPRVNGKQKLCPFYRVWRDVLRRCYSTIRQKKQPTYIGCTVVPEWLKFSNFREWMETQDWEGNAIDKDIIEIGNKEYGPDTCCFVPQRVNNLLTSNRADKGACPTGVNINHSRGGEYRAAISMYGKRKYLGDYETLEAASAAYRKAKTAHIKEVAMRQKDIRVREGLMRHAWLLCG